MAVHTCILVQHLPRRLIDAGAEAIRRLTIGDLSAYGLGKPPEGLYSHHLRTGRVPTFDSGVFIEAIKARRIQIVAGVERFDAGSIALADGERVRAEAVIVASGYRRDLEGLIGHLGLLDAEGRPIVHGPLTSPRAPGLFFVGFTDPFGGNFRQIRLDAKKIARAIARRSRGDRAAS
jgi:putative flavoprotein involved in K+ transport